MYLIEKQTPIHHITAKQDILMIFQPLPEIPDYGPQFIDPHYQQDPYWIEDL